jgi:hypothetical protein
MTMERGRSRPRVAISARPAISRRRDARRRARAAGPQRRRSTRRVRRRANQRLICGSRSPTMRRTTVRSAPTRGYGTSRAADAVDSHARTPPHASHRDPAVPRRGTHVVDPLPHRVRLLHTPGALRDVVRQSRRWRHFESELVIEHRGPTASASSCQRAGPICRPLVMASRSQCSTCDAPDDWRRFGKVLAGVQASGQAPSVHAKRDR